MYIGVWSHLLCFQSCSNSALFSSLAHSPLMMLVQRVSLIAFAIHDGMAVEESALNDDQRKQQIKYYTGCMRLKHVTL